MKKKLTIACPKQGGTRAIAKRGAECHKTSPTEHHVILRMKKITFTPDRIRQISRGGGGERRRINDAKRASTRTSAAKGTLEFLACTKCDSAPQAINLHAAQITQRYVHTRQNSLTHTKITNWTHQRGKNVGNTAPSVTESHAAPLFRGCIEPTWHTLFPTKYQDVYRTSEKVTK